MPTSPDPSVPSPPPTPRCCSVLTCASLTKLRSRPPSAERDPQGLTARLGALDKGIPQHLPAPFLTTLSHPASCWGGGLPRTTSEARYPQVKQLAQQCEVGLSGETESYVRFYPLHFITRRNNKIETFVWKMQWRSSRERGRAGGRAE